MGGLPIVPSDAPLVAVVEVEDPPVVGFGIGCIHTKRPVVTGLDVTEGARVWGATPARLRTAACGHRGRHWVTVPFVAKRVIEQVRHLTGLVTCIQSTRSADVKTTVFSPDVGESDVIRRGAIDGVGIRQPPAAAPRLAALRLSPIMAPVAAPTSPPFTTPPDFF